MPAWLIVIFCIWIYLSLGFGTFLILQVIAAKSEDSTLRDELDCEDDGVMIFGFIMIWPFAIIILLLYYICKGLGQINMMLRKELRKDDCHKGEEK